MKQSQSVFIDVRGLKYHCRVWGEEGAPQLFMLHGFQDVSASWQFTVDALQKDWRIIAPDWRGYGLTDWTADGCYWFPDYLADLDWILDEFEPDRPAVLVGHSMGGNAAALYAGVKPRRIRKFVNVEGFGGQSVTPAEIPKRIALWMRQMAAGDEQRPYASFEEFAERLSAENPRLTPERADFLARHWGKETEDGVVIRRADPGHKYKMPLPIHFEDSYACWGQITAQVLWVEANESAHAERAVREPELYQRRLSAYQNLAGLERIDNAGHNIHHDQPEELARVIEKFV